MPEEEKLDWYVVHTYSGYENKVMDSLRKTVENRNLQDKIDRVEVPVEEVIRRLSGIRCGGKATSCPDQLAKALEEIRDKG